jgi:GWxTD domain-containing protein
LTFSLAAAVLTGFSVSWTTVPAGPQREGSAVITLIIEQDDLVTVFESGAGFAEYEVSAAIDGRFQRAGGTVAEGGFPAVEELVFQGLSTGTHRVDAVLMDLETGERAVQRVDLVIDSTAADTWSSAGLRLSPSGTVRAAGDMVILWDVYPPAGTEPVQAAYAVLDQNLNVVREGWMELARQEEGVLSFSSRVSLGGLERGLYRVNAAATDGGSSVMASSSGSVRLLSSWDLWGDDLEETLTLIRPVASSREISDLREAAGPGQRQAVMSEFWLRRDPNPATRENEYLDIYRRRLDYIERVFTVGVTRGILTDMGIAWAKLGEPDVVEDYPFQVESQPYQVWTYFNPRLTLTFVDRHGYGLYEFSGEWQDVNRAFSLGEEWYVY